MEWRQEENAVDHFPRNVGLYHLPKHFVIILGLFTDLKNYSEDIDWSIQIRKNCICLDVMRIQKVQ